jgi:hypothetical protein
MLSPDPGILDQDSRFLSLIPQNWYQPDLPETRSISVNLLSQNASSVILALLTAFDRTEVMRWSDIGALIRCLIFLSQEKIWIRKFLSSYN